MNLRQERATPAPTLAERDSDGRLIGVVVDCSQPLSSAEDNAWLGSEHSLRAAAEATHFAGLIKSGAIHLINVQPWLGKETAESELLHRG